MTTVLITGATGSLGRVVLGQALAAGWKAIGTYHRTAAARLDVRDPADVRRVLAAHRLDVIVPAAAGAADPRPGRRPGRGAAGDRGG